MDPSFIIMRGYTGAGKSTLAKLLAPRIKAQVHHSAYIREELGIMPSSEEAQRFFRLDNPVFTKTMGDQVYGLMTERAIASVLCGHSAILDGGAHFLWQRQRYYTAAQQHRIPVFILQVVCPSEDEIKRRLKARLSDSDPLAEAPSWDSYLSSKRLSEPAADDVLVDGSKPTIIEYDSSSSHVKLIVGNPHDPNTAALIAVLEDLDALHPRQ